MHRILSILFPAQPSTIYIFTRNIIVLGICLFFLTRTVNTWIEYRLQPSQGLTSARDLDQDRADRAKNTLQPRTQVDIKTIVEGNIFGGSPVEPEKESQDADVELDDLPLAENLKEFQLIGTIITSDDQSWAIIENTKNNQQELKAVGDRIKEARITKIIRNNVVVNDGQQDAALSIDYKVRARLQDTSSEKSRRSNETQEEKQQQQRVNLERESVQSALTDFNKILEQARITPYLEEGISVGMQVSNIDEGSFFDTLQLKDGDILIRTEASELNSPQGILDLIQEIEGPDAVLLQIRRNGQDMTMQYQVE
jgi:type II secretion system protein C